MDIEKLLEIDALIKEGNSYLKKNVSQDIQTEIKQNIKLLENTWKTIAKEEYPMFINENNKKEDIRNELRKQKHKTKENKYKSPDLNDIITKHTNDNNLINSVLYDKNFASDHVNPYRKRKQ